MDLKVKYLSETCSDPIEFLNQLRQTTEPIGGSTVYDKDGELVEYDIAVIAIEKANNVFIEKACQGIEHLLSGYIIRNFHFGDSYDMDKLIDDFKKYMKGE